MTTSYDEHDLMPGVRVPVDPDAQRAFEAELAETRECELDHALCRGAIRTSDREKWRNRLRREPDLATDVLRDLPGDERLAGRALEGDPRLLMLERQWAEFKRDRADDRVPGR